MSWPSTLEGVCEVSVFEPTEPKQGGWLLIEVPHGATRTSDYEAVAARMKSRLPVDLLHFFCVNTDIGAPEGALWLGQHLAARGLGVVVARCLVPRTFIDTNRAIGHSEPGIATAGLTAAIPGYIDAPDDVKWLTLQHTRYHALVKGLYEQVCGTPSGRAVQLHSYAPKSVGIDKTDAGIVEALHAAYEPAVYAQWPSRPAVDFICATPDGLFRTAPKLIAALGQAYAAAGIEAKENATYHLHPVAMGYVYAKAYPEQVVCIELNRGLLADPFVPFGVSPLPPKRIEAMVAPIAEVLERQTH